MNVASVDLVMDGRTSTHPSIVQAVQRAASTCCIGFVQGATTLHMLRDALEAKDQEAGLLIQPPVRFGVRSPPLFIDLRHDPDPLYCLHRARLMVDEGVHPEIVMRRLRAETTRSLQALNQARIDARERCRFLLTETGLSADDRMLALWTALRTHGPDQDIVEGIVALFQSLTDARTASPPLLFAHGTDTGYHP